MTHQKILLVHTEKAPLQTLKTALAKAGLEIINCSSAFDALDETRTNPGDMVITSVDLPDLCGYQLSSMLKTTSPTRNLPVVVVGSKEELENSFWKHLSQADLTLEQSEISNDQSINKIRNLLTAANKADKEAIIQQACLPVGLSGRDLVQGYRETISILLMERSVTQLCRELIATIANRVDFMARYFGYTRKVFDCELSGLLVHDNRGPWGILNFDTPLSKSAFEKLQTTIAKAMGNPSEPHWVCAGEVSDKGGASLKCIEPIVVKDAQDKVLGAIVLAWSSKPEMEESRRMHLEILRREMQPVFNSLISAHENQVLKAEREYSSSQDAVTGLYNLQFFMGFLQQQLMFSHRQKLPVGVALIGIDNFTEINSEVGPQVADIVLHKVARRLASSVRSSDLLARYSGDEFALVLPNTDLAGSQILADKLRSEVEKIKWGEIGGGKIKVTISVGYAAFKQDDINPETILRDAKMALQSAKSSGRNCVAR